MTSSDKVIWTEGMFLRPQHMQQQDRYFDSQIRQQHRLFNRYGWGIKNLTIDMGLLDQGTLSVTRCTGVLPDGTLFSAGSAYGDRLVLSVSEASQGQILYLALPIALPGGDEVDLDQNSESMTRYQSAEQNVQDSNAGQDKVALLNTARPRFKLLLGEELSGDYSSIGIARLQEVSGDGAIVLDEHYIPASLDITELKTLQQMLNEVLGLLGHRADALVGRLTNESNTGTSEIADFLLLQLVNKYNAVLQHLSSINTVHPEELFSTLIMLAGELAAFTHPEKRLGDLPAYQHDDLQRVFLQVMTELRQSLSMVFEQTAIALELQERNYGVRVAPINDRNLLDDATFILAVKVEWPKDVIVSRFPTVAKVGGVEQLRELVNLQLPGIQLIPLPMAPRQIPRHSGFTYFELEKTSENWVHLRKSGGFSFHFSGDLPGFELEFWAVRE